ncbi:hypothetical protein Ddc_22551 [Ditylenchus destructor]|nr:hypothetical protein Ddc_22551 [Ditylenchus destructor]
MELTPETNFRELAEQIDIQVQATKDKRTHINNVIAIFLIGDFQRATKQREFSCTYHAWPSYAPPEWSKQPTLTNLFRKCTIKVDVWAIGVFFKKIKSQISDASDTFAEMLTPNALFNAEPARRPSFSEMLSSPLFQQC